MKLLLLSKILTTVYIVVLYITLALTAYADLGEIYTYKYAHILATPLQIQVPRLHGLKEENISRHSEERAVK